MGALLDRSRLRALLARWVEAPGARVLAALGFTPNRVTLLGLALSGVAAWLAATDMLVLAGGVFLLSGLLDLLDGALARRTGAATRFGGFLDSVGDRAGEAALLLGVLLLALDRDDSTLALLVYLALVSSMMVSYTRARAEGLGIPGAVGLLTRPERVVLLSFALFTGLLKPVLGVVAALALVTVLQRVRHVWRAGGRDEGEGE